MILKYASNKEVQSPLSLEVYWLHYVNIEAIIPRPEESFPERKKKRHSKTNTSCATLRTNNTFIAIISITLPAFEHPVSHWSPCCSVVIDRTLLFERKVLLFVALALPSRESSNNNIVSSLVKHIIMIDRYHWKYL